QGKGVTGKDIVSLVGPPKKKCTIAQSEQQLHERGAVLCFINIDIAISVVRINTETNSLVGCDADDYFETVRVNQPRFQRADVVEWLFFALSKRYLEGGSRFLEQLSQHFSGSGSICFFVLLTINS